MAPEALNTSQYPLLSTSFTAHRVSPLYQGDAPLDNPTLSHYASQFRDLLTGEVLRGVRVGLATNEDGLSRAGALRSVQWSQLKDEEDWQNENNESQLPADEMILNAQDHRGLLMNIAYEKATYFGLLMKSERVGDESSAEDEEEGFARYPLLLTRMPRALRATFLDFLAATFDTRASALKLPSQFLTNSLERYLSDLTTSEDGSVDAQKASKTLRTIIRDLLVTVSFSTPGDKSSLKSMDILVNRDDLFRMMTRGRKLQEINRRSNTTAPKLDKPFTTSLAHYIDGHLAMNLNHDLVSITKIACGAFVLGAEGKVKLFPPASVGDEDDVQTKATKNMVSELIKFASGTMTIS